MLIETLPEVLTWEGGAEILAKVHTEYVLHTSATFAGALARLHRDDHSALAHALTTFAELDKASRERFITAPEVTWRLYWPVSHIAAERCSFFAEALDAEVRRAAYLRGGTVSSRKDVWTPVGDMCFRHDGSVFEAPTIRRQLAADFASPFARTTDTGVPGGVPTAARQPMTTASQAVALTKLRSAADRIALSGERIWAFVATFTKALVIQPDPDLSGFASGSSGQFVGRSALWNVQSEGVDEIDVAEGFVHEAIHSVLYMQERLRPWVHKQELYGPELRITSPWTGNLLPLRPFLQACFVWYGLTNFWLAALRATVFQRERVNERLSQALCGFVKGNLLSRVDEYRQHLSPELLATVRDLQERVLAGVETLATGR